MSSVKRLQTAASLHTTTLFVPADAFSHSAQRERLKVARILFSATWWKRHSAPPEDQHVPSAKNQSVNQEGSIVDQRRLSRKCDGDIYMYMYI